MVVMGDVEVLCDKKILNISAEKAVESTVASLMSSIMESFPFFDSDVSKLLDCTNISSDHSCAVIVHFFLLVCLQLLSRLLCPLSANYAFQIVDK